MQWLNKYVVIVLKVITKAENTRKEMQLLLMSHKLQRSSSDSTDRMRYDTIVPSNGETQILFDDFIDLEHLKSVLGRRFRSDLTRSFLKGRVRSDQKSLKNRHLVPVGRPFNQLSRFLCPLFRHQPPD